MPRFQAFNLLRFYRLPFLRINPNEFASFSRKWSFHCGFKGCGNGTRVWENCPPSTLPLLLRSQAIFFNVLCFIFAGIVANEHFTAVLKACGNGTRVWENSHFRHCHFYCGHKLFFQCVIFHFRWPCFEFHSVCGKKTVFASSASWGKLPL